MKRNRITQHRVLSKEILEVEPNEFSTIVFCFGIDKMKKCSERAPMGRARDFNIMRKKIIILVIAVLVIVAAGGGVFWWENQKEVRELNKNLPEGVRVVKSLFGKEYRVINKIDGYEFKIPKEWESFGKIQEAEYNEWKEDKLITHEGEIGLKGEGGLLAISVSKPKEENIELNSFVEAWSEIYVPSLTREILKEKISNFEVIKVQDKSHLADLKFLFFKIDSKIYRISLIDDKFIREILFAGKW
jgi:hypothetical protein